MRPTRFSYKCVAVVACLFGSLDVTSSFAQEPVINRDSNSDLIESKLDQITTVELINKPLSSVLVLLAKQHGISMRIDPEAVKANPNSPSLPIIISLKDVTLRSALRLMLREHDLDYMIRDRRLLVTTAALAKSTPQERRYPVSAKMTATSQQLIDAINATLLSDKTGQFKMEGQTLVAMAPRAVLSDIDSLLKQIQDQSSEQSPRAVAESAISLALRRPAKFEFSVAPMQEVLQQVSHEHNVPIVVDRQALKRGNLSPDVPVVFQVDGVKLGDAFRFLLHQYDMSYVIKNEIIMVTTKSIVDSYMDIRVHTLPDNAIPQMDKVQSHLIKRSHPLWTINGGKNRVATFQNHVIVYGNYQAQAATAGFVDMLGKRFDALTK